MYLQSTMTTMMTMMMMMITTRTGTITPTMTAILLLSICDCVVVPSIIHASVADDGTDVASSIVVVHVTGVISPGLDACDIVATIVWSVGVGKAPV